MGSSREVKLLVLIGLFLLTCFFVYRGNEPIATTKKPPIVSYLNTIPGYRTMRSISLDKSLIRMLDLDDYAFADYLGARGKINLYIGYYYTANKASAAHTPLICYPSQGWKIESRPASHSLLVGPHIIHYEEIVSSHNEKKELVLYWYQSHLKTNTHHTWNKVDIALNTLNNNDEQHAFVRVAVPFDSSTYAETKKAATDFIAAFYPQFIGFITGEKPASFPAR